MTKLMNKHLLGFQAAFVTGLLLAKPAAATGTTGGNDWSDIARNITTSLEEVPGLIAGLAYMIGLLLGIMGVLKLKDHVENPTQTPLKDGAIRLAAGGALFALPIVFESMLNTIGTTNTLVGPSEIRKVEFNIR